MDKLNLAIIGLGARGIGLLKYAYLEHEEVEFTAICDSYADRCEKASELIVSRGRKKPYQTTDYKEILKREDVDAVIIATSWSNHINICIEAMEAKKAVGCEVGGAYSIWQCYKLLETYERTKTPIMLLENCIFGRNEMMLRNMAEMGKFGTLVHCEGGYRHDLRDEIAYGVENRHYRLTNYMKRNAENYPTHELGPIAKILGINNGNRMVSLVSVASKAVGIEEFIRDNKKEDLNLKGKRFNQGDVVNTIIKCMGGETISLTLDTTLPRYYSRGLVIQGTKGMYCEENDSLFFDGAEHAKDHFEWKKHWGNITEYYEKYDHPVWQKYIRDGVKAGHDGMDWLVFVDFVEYVKGNKKPEIDIYDMVSWMSITALSEESIAKGGAVVSIPDFTDGNWMCGEY